MKNVFISLVSLLSFFSLTPVFAQSNNTGKISGRIVNKDGTPGAFATVTLLKASDSVLVKGAISDENGEYHFEKIPFGKYIISVSVIGMDTAFSESVSLNADNNDITIPIITLQPNTKLLKGVQVTAARPFIQHKPGETIVNVENSPVSAGNTVMEVLEKSPGIIVDQNGNISMNGKSGVNVMINGQPTHLTPSQLAMVLKAMPANSVSQIELMTQPPAKYSAEGTAGLIDIVLKKNTAIGFNGSLTAGVGYGQYPKYNAGGSINYRNKNFSLYSNYNFNHQQNRFNLEITRDFYAPNSNTLTTIMQQASLLKVNGNNHTGQLGMDFYLTPKQTIGFVANGSINKGNFSTYSPVYFMDGSQNTDSISTSTNDIGYNWQNGSINLHYNLDMNKGSSLTTNVDYNRFYQSMPQTLFTNVTDAQGNVLHAPNQHIGQQPSNIKIYAAKLDYVHPMKHNLKLEAGLKYSFVNSDNNSKFEIYQDNKWVNDPGNTNHFIYKENVNAAYITLSKTFKKGWSADAGVRGEQTITHTDQLTTDSLNQNNYFDLFPNVSLTKTINAGNNISLSYTRRIDRPDYQSLNPFVYYIDQYTYQLGNPYLKPQFVNSVELSYVFKQMYSAVLNFSHTNDIMAQIMSQNDTTHVAYQGMGNLGSLNALTLTIGIPVNITRWWNTYNSLQGFYNIYHGIYDGYYLNKGIASFMLYTQQNFMLPAGLKGELTGMYSSETITGPSIRKPFGMISAGVSKSLMKGKSTLKLNVQDILQSMRFRNTMNFGDLHNSDEFRLNDRAVNLTFTWNFGNEKIRVNQYKNTGIQQEEQRIKKGGGTP